MHILELFMYYYTIYKNVKNKNKLLSSTDKAE